MYVGIKRLGSIFGGFAVEIQSFLKEILDAEKGVQECSDIALKERVKGMFRFIGSLPVFLLRFDRFQVERGPKLDRIRMYTGIANCQTRKL